MSTTRPQATFEAQGKETAAVQETAELLQEAALVADQGSEVASGTVRARASVGGAVVIIVL